MDESNAKVLVFSSREVADALVEIAKRNGSDVSMYSSFELRISEKGSEIQCILFEPTTKELVNGEAKGDA
jgi:hypothetical protein